MVERTADHPGGEELRDYARGLLAPESAPTLEQHLAGCTTCCALLEQTPADSFLIRLRDAGSTAPLGSDRGSAAGPEIPPELVAHPRYRVQGLVGQGGMGAVYRAEHLRMERPVALKVLRPGLMRDPAAVERFHQEVRAAARLHHPHIVTAHDADQAGALHFLVMEYVEGTSLAELVRRRGPLPVAEACDYVRQAALGLQHAHERGMVHRDVKPHNLMRTPQGLIKILDFGLARLPRAVDGSPGGNAPTGTLTGVGAVMGTADYIAPEQAHDPRIADIRADIYALGCTLFHLLTGRPPYPDGSTADKLARHADTPLPLSELRPGTPPALAAVLARMTAKDPAARYATPDEVTQALMPFCAPRSRHQGLGISRPFLVTLGVLAILIVAVVLYLRHRIDRRAVEGDTAPFVPRQAVRPDDAPADGDPAEQVAAQAVRKLGGGVHRNDQLPGKPVIVVHLEKTQVTDEDLRLVQSFPQLTYLELGGTKVSDAGLAHLEGLKHLIALGLIRTKVTDAGLKHLTGLKHLQSLALSFTRVGDDGMKALTGLTELRTLSLDLTRVTDAGMADVGRLHKLTMLTLYQTAITDEGVKHLAGLTELTTLNLSLDRAVGDEGMKTVAGMKKMLVLDLFRTRVTDEGLKELGKLKHLGSLQIGGTKVTDAGLPALADLDKLEILDLSETAVTDQGLKEVVKLRGLKTLNLQSDKGVTDAGLKELAALPRLKMLILTGTGVTDAGVEDLRKARPDLRIQR